MVDAQFRPGQPCLYSWTTHQTRWKGDKSEDVKTTTSKEVTFVRYSGEDRAVIAYRDPTGPQERRVLVKSLKPKEGA